MNTYGVVLALHIMAVLAAFALSGGLHVAEYLMKGAGTVAEVRALARSAKLAPLFGPIVIAIFGLGLVLLQLDEGSAFSAGDGWVWTAMVALTVLALDGPLVLGRYAKKLDAMVHAAPDGPVPAEVRAQAASTVPWAVSYANSFLALGVVLNMSTKPSTAVAIVVLLLGAGIGAALGLGLSRRSPSVA